MNSDDVDFQVTDSAQQELDWLRALVDDDNRLMTDLFAQIDEITARRDDRKACIDELQSTIDRYR